ncbi:hypothetical protein ANAEL_04816 [Anaerolineales bacterium]|nr:hypothetical protein ANAEL_04816 [Anaerolineales bacterium]
MSQTSTVPPFINKMMKFMLGSPMHGLVSKIALLISFTGRKSGRAYTTPVSYSKFDDQVYIFTHANWWKNLKGGAPVTLRLQGQDVQGLAEPVIEDKQVIATRLTEHLRKVPSDAPYYGVTLDKSGNPRAEEVEKGVHNVVMIRVRLN